MNSILDGWKYKWKTTQLIEVYYFQSKPVDIQTFYNGGQFDI